MTTYAELFKAATGFEPYPYQVDFATREEIPSLVSVPTGCGKTAAVILGWLWRRRFAGQEIRQATPRRLVYCLPMRVLVEQTRDCAVTWLHRLGRLGGKAVFEKDGDGIEKLAEYDPWAGVDAPDKIRVHLLMGGDVDRDWDRYPERDAILIGTQDMLLSRALNRGYAMSRFRWPVHFALLNNDCLWVMDEVQLMGSGLATTAQIQAFRRKLGTASRVQSVWMSATMRPEWLATVDFEQASDAPGDPIEIDEKDKHHAELRLRYEAVKPLRKAEFEATTDGKSEAALAIKRHTPGTRTMVVVNRVKRAQSIYQALKSWKPAAEAEIVLVHSHFRPPDRKAALDRLLAKPGKHGTIGVCTQVVEAGVDVSTKTLITDLAPWASLVQRFGRCNREGEFFQQQGAKVFWIKPENLQDDKNLKVLPYSAAALRLAAAQLERLTDVGPASLPPFEESMAFSHVVRRKDVVELFDTTPDLAGADIDISRFIREADEHDVQVFWRDIPKEGPRQDEKGPAREELCSVPVSMIDLKDRAMWRWDHLEKRWERARSIYPGLLLMLRGDEGGYDCNLGWTGKEKRTDPLSLSGETGEADGDDPRTKSLTWTTLSKHTDEVVEELARLLSALPLDDPAWGDALRLAARWHDAGKTHEVFRMAVSDGAPIGPVEVVWGKCAGGMKRYGRPGFRHELASALAMLQHGLPDLATYLVAAHHGKVRLSIRSLPHERHPDDTEKRFARGVWENDVLPRTELGGSVVMAATVLKLAYMELGDDDETGASWLTRMLGLRATHGPFRLALLEALLRVADWRASKNGEEVQG